MSTGNYICAASVPSPRPPCTCGVGDDQPVSRHKVGWSRWGTITRAAKECLATPGWAGPPDWAGRPIACDIYIWGRTCWHADAAYQCSRKTCGQIIAYCNTHGGMKRALEEASSHSRVQHGPPLIVIEKV